MEEKKYFVGLDIGTDSVGYAVTDENYRLCKFKGEDMWGVTLFDEALSSAERRGYRTARRRLDRRQQRVFLISELFAAEIAKIDEGFFRRIKESRHYPESEEDKIRLFSTYAEQKAYTMRYPTIHHLITELMNSTEQHDARLVYVACAWLVAHRGHFLSEVDRRQVDKITDFKSVYQKMVDFIERDEYALPWSADVDLSSVGDALKVKLGVTKKYKRLASALFGEVRVPKVIDEAHEYNFELLLKLLCGGKVSLKDLFGKDEYGELEEKSLALGVDDERLSAIMQSLEEEDAELISVLKSVYDWSVLVEILNGHGTISEAKVAVYERHQNDLRLLKRLIKKYVPQKYYEVFRSTKIQNNYVAYVGKNKTSNLKCRVKKSANREELCKYVASVVKSIVPDEGDVASYNELTARLESADFMPKQVDGDNRVIPYQLYLYELNKILENAGEYIPFLREKDADGISGARKILSVFEFRVPYYVGPLKEKSSPKLNHWMVRRAAGRILPWNFELKVDLDASEEAFIAKMTNTCTYLPGEKDVLPKNSLIYSAFEVLNEINNIKINGREIPTEIKQGLYENVFMRYERVSVKRITEYLKSNNLLFDGDVLTGLDITVKSSLRPFRQFEGLVRGGLLTYPEVERIISRAAYSEDKARFSRWLCREFPNLPDGEVKYIAGLKLKDFGRMSKKLLCGIEGADRQTGETYTVIRAMWETNCNLMQLLSDRFTFAEQIRAYVEEYYGANPRSISERLDEMHVSNSVKRPIIRTLDILKDIVKVKGCEPERIFVEMARGAGEEQKGRRTSTRLAQILELYKRVEDSDIRLLSRRLEEWGESAHNRLQSDKLFLYFMQLGKCLYTGKDISLESVLAGDGAYNIEHIYPRSFVKDDSVINNKILVDSKANGAKDDVYPIDASVRAKMCGYWTHLNKLGLISDEKYARLTRSTGFTDEERYEFINRQLVETRQSTKAVADLLRGIYPKTEIIYVKAGLVSDFRKQFKFLKSRTVNDLHHAKDAYLNVVVGNVWHSKFSRQFWRADERQSVKTEVIFTRPVTCRGKCVWGGAQDKDRVLKIAGKNTAHLTMYSYCKRSGQNGGFFNQNPLPAAEGLIPLKKGMSTEIYGGYDSATVAGFVLAKYMLGRKSEISFVPLKLVDMNGFLNDQSFAVEYISRELGEKAHNIEILFNNRIFKIYSMISLDGARFCIRGKAGLSNIGLMNMMPFMTSADTELYIKRLESFNEKHKKNESLVWDERFDGVSKEKNLRLYTYYIQKLASWPYNKRPANATLVGKLKMRENDFSELDVFKQSNVLLQIQGIFGRIKQADLKDINESSSSGIATMSVNLSNWKKSYTDVRIIDSSASGLFETVSENLLDLL